MHFSEVWLSRGIVFEELGRWEEAAASYRQALSLEPDDDDIRRYCAAATQKATGHAAAAAAIGISTLGSPGCCSSGVDDEPLVAELAELVATIAVGLQDHHHAVVDHFCTDTAELRAWIHALHTKGKLRRGEVSASAQASARNDITTSISATEVDTHPPTLREFIATLDATVHALQQQLSPAGVLATDESTTAAAAAATATIPPSLLREEMQATCYPSGGGG